MMRRSPDGKREVFEVSGALPGKRSRIVLVSGLGLPTKVGIGAYDLPDETWLKILNRDVSGTGLRYDMIEEVHGGMVRLDEMHLQGADQTMSMNAGATFGEGTRTAPCEDEGHIIEILDGDTVYPDGTSAWLVTDVRGKALLVSPYQTDSIEIAGILKDHIHGEFTVEQIWSGTMTASENLTVHGWPLAKSAYVPPPSITFN